VTENSPMPYTCAVIIYFVVDMSLISVQALEKKFRIVKPRKGAFSAIKNLLFPEYSIKKALNSISFEIEEGELVGYIGPNGAGKSTTVKLLSGILTPDAGDVRVLGKSPWKHRQEIVRHLGVVFGQKTQLWWDIPVIESFKLLRDIYRIPQKEYAQTLDLLVATLDLSHLLNTPVRQLSLGQRMRSDIAASLIHSPKILFLDEPTIGLDAVSKLSVRDCIRRLNKEKKVTILLTTHDMDDIESLCTRVLILNEGRIFLDGTLHELRKTILPERRLVVDLVNQNDSIHDVGADVIKQEGHRVWFSYNPELVSTPQLIAEVTRRYSISDLFVENPPIEEIVAKLYKTANL
jgi:ABC-2 type transport system ATP-binding protein